VNKARLPGPDQPSSPKSDSTDEEPSQ
jgi:hypothetical protein